MRSSCEDEEERDEQQTQIYGAVSEAGAGTVRRQKEKARTAGVGVSMEMEQEASLSNLPGLIGQILRPKPEDIFYHYCSVETFRLICEHKCLRFSDINMLNDYNENTWGYRVFEEAASMMLSKPAPPEMNGLDKSFFDEIDKVICSMPLIAHPVICSFSKDPDVLSQWRAYASDGTGVAIGFTGNFLKSLPAMLLQVEYNHEKQLSGMVETLIAIYLAEAEKNHSRGEDFVRMCGQLALFKIAYKNPAFAEEKEVRSVHLLTVKKDNDMPRLEDDGGLVDGKTEVPGQPVKYRTYRDGLIAYIDLPIPLDVNPQPVRELWIGPKNPNWAGNFLYMMSTYGFKDYKIHPSAATYR